MPKIALLSGSLRRESSNTAVIATMRRILEQQEGCEAVDIALRSFPPFDEDVERSGGTQELRAVSALVAGSDALVISSPAYNGYPPGMLKNALDWLSRPPGGGVIKGMPVGIASASPGRAGGANVQPRLAEILTNSGASVVECATPVAVGNAVALRTPEGIITDAAVLADLERLVADVLAAVGAPATAPVTG
ncbi:NADPH-dependent FMN reductase [Streptomyces sp. GSL17-111]|uniref:NADPH-dependent FMN reductase n=1 Tax=Streptomyces sp. GSL17-111 TaxID=3121596 RepID=UPI0030F3FEA2